MIKASEDSTLQYMNFMNVIFAAQKKVGITAELTSSYLIMYFSDIDIFICSIILFMKNILIDACVLDSDSGLLQQVLCLIRV